MSTDFDSMGQFTDTVAGDVRDPYPELALKRRDSPVELNVQMGYDLQDRMTATVYQYDDVATVLRDHETFSSGAIRDLLAVVMGPYVMVGMDEPEHKRHRHLVSHAFRSKALAHWEDDLMGDVVDELIDKFAGRGRAELVQEFTFRFPVQVIAEVLGVPRSDYEQFHGWAVDIINVAADPDAGIRAGAAMREYLVDFVEARRREPGADVISDLVTSEIDGELLDDEEIYSFLRLLLPAGAETTYRASGNFLYGLLTHPDQLEMLKADRSLMQHAVEEAIRWETPLLITSRRCLADTEIHGVNIPAGADVIPHLGSANHDESHWDNPEEFDITREPKPQIAFGVGPHMCIGMHLARLELKVAVNRLLDRLPNLRLDPHGDDPHIHGERFRSPTSLPVLFG
ncbi:MAG TPA: cytochrome P450 [Acidimicrobiales bacterium]|nr:cytochrome P450 [Acidimicrobiales bacterium]